MTTWEAYEWDEKWFVGSIDHDSGPIMSIHGWPDRDEEVAKLAAAAPKLQAENHRLRAALQAIVDDEGLTTWDGVLIARAALEEKP